MSTETTSAQAQRAPAQAPGRSVRDATFDVFRRRGLTRLFANPGSTEVPFLTDLPGDFDFVLALHEGSVVGLATGFALGRGAPSLALLHTTAGLGNGVSAIATARVNRAPLVILVGQQDRRHLAYEPFLAGRLAGLAGDYPVRVEQPIRAQDVPAAVERAFHAATIARGPALVIVPMDDWEAQADEEREPAAALGEVIRAGAAAPEAVDALAAFLDGAHARPRSSSAPAPTTPHLALRSSRSPSVWARPCTRRRSARAPASRTATASSPGCCRPAGPACGSGWRRTTRCSSSAAPPSASRSTRRDASPCRARASRS